MKISKAYKTELKPNNKQKTLLRKSAGTSRFTYNWGLSESERNYQETGKRLSPMELHRSLNKLKKTVFPWMYEVSKCAPQEALRDLDKAYNNFFIDLKKKKENPKYRMKFNLPIYKSKKKSKKSFRLTGSIKVENNHIKLPRIGKVRLKERGYIPKDKHILSATCSERAGRWFVSVSVEEEIEQVKKETIEKDGVDLGINRFAAISDRTFIESHRTYKKFERMLRIANKKLSRREYGSARWFKVKKEIAKLHKKVADIRLDFLHKLTTVLAKTKSTITIEDLNIKGLMKTNISKSLQDAALGMFRVLLTYKCIWYGTELIIADRFYPSSKLCSNCNWYNPYLKRKDRIFKCLQCHLKIDRDLNAAINLQKYQERLAASSTASIKAHRVETSGSAKLSFDDEVSIAVPNIQKDIWVNP